MATETNDYNLEVPASDHGNPGNFDELTETQLEVLEVQQAAWAAWLTNVYFAD